MSFSSHQRISARGWKRVSTCLIGYHMYLISIRPSSTNDYHGGLPWSPTDLLHLTEAWVLNNFIQQAPWRCCTSSPPVFTLPCHPVEQDWGCPIGEKGDFHCSLSVSWYVRATWMYKFGKRRIPLLEQAVNSLIYQVFLVISYFFHIVFFSLKYNLNPLWSSNNIG